MHFCFVFCLVLGSIGMVDSKRDFSIGGTISWAECHGLCEYGVYFCDSAIIFVDVVSYEVWDLLVLLWLGVCDVGVRGVLGPGDKGRSDRRNDGESLEATLVLEEIYE